MEEKTRNEFKNFIKESKDDRENVDYVYNIVSVYKKNNGNYIISFEDDEDDEKENLVFLYSLNLKTGKPVSWLERIHFEESEVFEEIE